MFSRKKGKGFEAALKFPEKFHGTGPYDVKTGDSTPAPRPARRRIIRT
jgi:1-deoxy-D-xylulose-5-phosphate synthase